MLFSFNVCRADWIFYYMGWGYTFRESTKSQCIAGGSNICFYYAYICREFSAVYDRYICEHFVWPCSWSFVRLFWLMDKNYGQFIHNNALWWNQHHLIRLIYERRVNKGNRCLCFAQGIWNKRRLDDTYEWLISLLSARCLLMLNKNNFKIGTKTTILNTF